MRNVLLLLFIISLLSSCAPVLKQEYLNKGDADVTLSEFIQKPAAFKGKLYILGGTIAETKQSPGGSLIEALYVPVDPDGKLKRTKGIDGRFLALFPKAKGVLDPRIYGEGQLITIAGEFTGLQPGKIDEIDYLYPVFEIKDMHLWKNSAPGSWFAPYPEAGPYPGPYPLRDPFWKDRAQPYWR